MEINLTDAIALVEWFNENKRALPWRDTGDSYDVWLSEVMLQQTRIEAVREKFIQFKQTLPAIENLANVDDDVLMRLWEGLGYYNRARNLKKCAQEVLTRFSGKLPETYDQLVTLPGIGPYTAGAIASIAFGEAVPAVDGNVMRVLARVFEDRRDVRKTETKQWYEECIHSLFDLKHDPNFVSSLNQGLMELGEVVCIPNGKPLCDKCPFCKHCLSCIHHTYDEIPYRSALRKRKEVKKTIIVVRNGDRFLIHKRSMNGLLAGMYEFFNVDTHLVQKDVIAYLTSLGFEALHVKALPSSKHLFTHLEWNMKAYEVTVSDDYKKMPNQCSFVMKEELDHMAIPSAFHQYVEYYMLREKRNTG